MDKLSGDELISLVQSVFPKSDDDKRIAILVDIPRGKTGDTSNWQARRLIAENWFLTLKTSYPALFLEGVSLIAYPDVGSNNADLPETVYIIRENLPPSAEQLPEFGKTATLETVFQEHQLFLAPTQYSTTAPLKVAARKHGFRAATMPGFSSEMLPALRIDYNEVFRRVTLIKEKLDPAVGAEVIFCDDNGLTDKMYFDLRFRQAHLSSGRFPEKGVAGNLPSGETYIVPYEGEKGEPSQTSGILPVQLDGAILRFTINQNRAVHVACNNEDDEYFLEERKHLQDEPAYGNMAELGFGVLSDFGLKAINEILLDEKLGFHVAFGRSDHFGGIVGPKDFSCPQAVIHLDRIYIPATQPGITVQSIILNYENGRRETILENGQYLIF